VSNRGSPTRTNEPARGHRGIACFGNRHTGRQGKASRNAHRAPRLDGGSNDPGCTDGCALVLSQTCCSDDLPLPWASVMADSFQFRTVGRWSELGHPSRQASISRFNSSTQAISLSWFSFDSAMTSSCPSIPPRSPNARRYPLALSPRLGTPLLIHSPSSVLAAFPSSQRSSSVTATKTSRPLRTRRSSERTCLSK
jgi:hypothetical protein